MVKPITFRLILGQLSAAQAIGRRMNPQGERLLRWLRRRYWEDGTCTS